MHYVQSKLKFITSRVQHYTFHYMYCIILFFFENTKVEKSDEIEQQCLLGQVYELQSNLQKALSLLTK